MDQDQKWESKGLRILGEIASGSFGTVYRVEDICTANQFALKEICVERFIELVSKSKVTSPWTRIQREVEALRKLDSELVVKYLDSWHQGTKTEDELNNWTPDIPGSSGLSTLPYENFFCIKMELCEFTLRDWLIARPDHNDRKLKEIYAIFDKIFQGLVYIHFQGLVHRDLKPANILMNCRQVDEETSVTDVKIGDFGLARMDSEFESSMTHGVGSKPYMSPEMFKNEDYDFKTDVFSTGLMFFESVFALPVNWYQEIFYELRQGNYAGAFGIFDTNTKDSFKSELWKIRMFTNINRFERICAKEALQVLHSQDGKKKSKRAEMEVDTVISHLIPSIQAGFSGVVRMVGETKEALEGFESRPTDTESDARRELEGAARHIVQQGMDVLKFLKDTKERYDQLDHQ